MIIEKNEAGQQGVELSSWDAAFLGMVAREGLSDEMWLDNLQSHFLHYFNYTGIFSWTHTSGWGGWWRQLRRQNKHNSGRPRGLCTNERLLLTVAALCCGICNQD